MEGKKWNNRSSESKLSKGERPKLADKEISGSVDVESRRAMARRADIFLNEYLLPLLDDASESGTSVVAIVSHGL